MDTSESAERFEGYEAELKLISADLSQKLDSLPSLSGDARKSAVLACESLVDEARELLGGPMTLEISELPTSLRTSLKSRLRNHQSDLDALSRRLASLSSNSAALFGKRYTDDPAGKSGDEHLEQRQQLLAGTDRLARSSGRLRESQRLANETEAIGADTLRNLAEQRQQIEHTRGVLLESEGYTDRSIKTLRGMARRMATNRIVTIAIITVLVLLIIAVVVSKFA